MPPHFQPVSFPQKGFFSFFPLLLLLLLSTNLYSAPNHTLISGTLHTKHEHNTKANTFKSWSKSLAICLSKKVRLDCSLESCDILY